MVAFSRKPKILFIVPQLKGISSYLEPAKTNSRLASLNLTFYPMSVPLLAALTPESDFAMAYVNEYWGEPIDYGTAAEIVALSFLTASAPRAYEIADNFRRLGKLVVMGGMHVSYCQAEARQHADVIFVGEAEEIWPQFLKDFQANTVQPVYQAPRCVPPALIPIPNRRVAKRPRPLTNISLQTSRGCPYACDFCAVSSFFGQQVRTRAVDSVMQEIQEAMALEGNQVRKIVFKDDNCVINHNFAFSLLEKLIPLKVSWLGQTTVRSLDEPELIKLMERSGCIVTCLGLESAHQPHITRFGKSYEDIGKTKEIVELLHKHNITVWGSYMFGFDEDTPDSFQITLEQAKYLELDVLMFNVRTPFPGTTFYQQLEREGRLTEKRWEYYDIEHLVFEPRRISSADLYDNIITGLKYFYSVPEVLRRIYNTGKRVISSRGWRHFKYASYFNLVGRSAINIYAKVHASSLQAQKEHAGGSDTPK